MANKWLIPVSFKNKGSQFYLNQEYINWLIKAGKQPVLLMPTQNLLEEIKSCEGLLLTGGLDIDPILFGEDNENSISTSPDMDLFHIQCVRLATEQGKKVFGICRGFQLLARMTTMNLAEYQFVQEIGHAHPQSDTRDKRVHFVYRITDHNDIKPVNSMHHQALTMSTKIPRSSMSVQPIYVADKKKDEVVVESAFFTINNSLCAGVQWHPEELNDINELVDYEREYERKHKENNNNQ